MNSYNVIRERYEDALLERMMEAVRIAQGQAALAENQRLRADPGAAVPRSLDQKCRQLITREVRRGRLGRYRAGAQSTVRLVSRIAIVLMVLVLSLTVAFAVSPQLQSFVARFRFVVKQSPDHSEFTFPRQESDDSAGQVVYDENGVWIGTKLDLSAVYIPEGLELTSDQTDNRSRVLQYVDGKNRCVDILASVYSSKLWLNSKNATSYLITINGQSGIVTYSDSESLGSIMITIPEYRGYLLILGEGIPEKELLKIAESIPLP